jgi:hypothetical protein
MTLNTFLNWRQLQEALRLRTASGGRITMLMRREGQPA